ncbi:UDP-N-acetylmuramate dehydrogenase [Candidatus Kaiserbacteria bacterium]|nr:UDP-N-acetylmuramate dehydrogenase [Candidatus Kaiserbacteria bacterium]
MEIKRNVSLKKFTTFRIGGRADFFVSVQTEAELHEALSFARKKRLKTFILGGGSNIVFSDDGFRGLVIKMDIKGIVLRHTHTLTTLIEVGAGEVWDELVSFTVGQGLCGIENLSGIPGTVGAAPIQNIGAYGVEVKDTVEWVEVMNQKTGAKKRLSHSACGFSYRDSIFKHAKGGNYVITRVCFRLVKDGAPVLSYKDVAQYFEGKETPPLKDVRTAILTIRKGKFPDLSKVGTAGSFFKNPIITNAEYRTLRQKFPDTLSYYYDRNHVKIPLGFILERMGWKGRTLKRVGVYDRHALVLVATRHATRKELQSLVEMISNDVKKQTGITIEEEVSLVS